MISRISAARQPQEPGFLYPVAIPSYLGRTWSSFTGVVPTINRCRHFSLIAPIYVNWWKFAFEEELSGAGGKVKVNEICTTCTYFCMHIDLLDIRTVAFHGDPSSFVWPRRLLAEQLAESRLKERLPVMDWTSGHPIIQVCDLSGSPTAATRVARGGVKSLGCLGIYWTWSLLNYGWLFEKLVLYSDRYWNYSMYYHCDDYYYCYYQKYHVFWLLWPTLCIIIFSSINDTALLLLLLLSLLSFLLL